MHRFTLIADPTGSGHSKTVAEHSQQFCCALNIPTARAREPAYLSNWFFKL